MDEVAGVNMELGYLEGLRSPLSTRWGENFGIALKSSPRNDPKGRACVREVSWVGSEDVQKRILFERCSAPSSRYLVVEVEYEEEFKAW